MIAAYHGNADGSAAKASPSTPLRLRRKPLRGFRGCDRSARPRKKCRHALQGKPYMLR